MATLSEPEQIAAITSHALSLGCTITEIRFVSDHEAIEVYYTDEKQYKNKFRMGSHWEPHEDVEHWHEMLAWSFDQREALVVHEDDHHNAPVPAAPDPDDDE